MMLERNFYKKFFYTFLLIELTFTVNATDQNGTKSDSQDDEAKNGTNYESLGPGLQGSNFSVQLLVDKKGFNKAVHVETMEAGAKVKILNDIIKSNEMKIKKMNSDLSHLIQDAYESEELNKFRGILPSNVNSNIRLVNYTNRKYLEMINYKLLQIKEAYNRFSKPENMVTNRDNFEVYKYLIENVNRTGKAGPVPKKIVQHIHEKIDIVGDRVRQSLVLLLFMAWHLKRPKYEVSLEESIEISENHQLRRLLNILYKRLSIVLTENAWKYKGKREKLANLKTNMEILRVMYNKFGPDERANSVHAEHHIAIEKIVNLESTPFTLLKDRKLRDEITSYLVPYVFKVEKLKQDVREQFFVLFRILRGHRYLSRSNREFQVLQQYIQVSFIKCLQRVLNWLFYEANPVFNAPSNFDVDYLRQSTELLKHVLLVPSTILNDYERTVLEKVIHYYTNVMLPRNNYLYHKTDKSANSRLSDLDYHNEYLSFQYLNTYIGNATDLGSGNAQLFILYDEKTELIILEHLVREVRIDFDRVATSAKELANLKTLNDHVRRVGYLQSSLNDRMRSILKNDIRYKFAAILYNHGGQLKYQDAIATDFIVDLRKHIYDKEKSYSYDSDICDDINYLRMTLEYIEYTGEIRYEGKHFQSKLAQHILEYVTSILVDMQSMPDYVAANLTCDDARIGKDCDVDDPDFMENLSMRRKLLLYSLEPENRARIHGLYSITFGNAYAYFKDLLSRKTAIGITELDKASMIYLSALLSGISGENIVGLIDVSEVSILDNIITKANITISDTFIWDIYNLTDDDYKAVIKSLNDSITVTTRFNAYKEGYSKLLHHIENLISGAISQQQPSEDNGVYRIDKLLVHYLIDRLENPEIDCYTRQQQINIWRNIYNQYEMYPNQLDILNYAFLLAKKLIYLNKEKSYCKSSGELFYPLENGMMDILLRKWLKINIPTPWYPKEFPEPFATNKTEGGYNMHALYKKFFS